MAGDLKAGRAAHAREAGFGRPGFFAAGLRALDVVRVDIRGVQLRSVAEGTILPTGRSFGIDEVTMSQSGKPHSIN